jgi:DNA-binding MarR family transcriptional regulator
LFDLNLFDGNQSSGREVAFRGTLRVDTHSAPAEQELDLGPLDDLVGYRIRILQIAAFKDFEGNVSAFGQAPRYFGLLQIVQCNPGLSQTQLAAAIHLVRSSLVPILDKLEAEGLVERRPSLTDRRLKCVSLTTKGARVVAALHPLVQAHEARLTHQFSAADKTRLLDLLKRANHNLQLSKMSADAA